jgi:hypothetical protein
LELVKGLAPPYGGDNECSWVFFEAMAVFRPKFHPMPSQQRGNYAPSFPDKYQL